MKTIVWLHGDGLSPQNPALVANEGAPAVFVFDDALLTQWQIGLKRVVFLYESLLELPVSIRRGDVAAEVSAFAREQQRDSDCDQRERQPALCGDLQPD